MIKKTYEKEIKENAFLLSKIQDSFCREHIKVLMNWYIEKAVKNKYYFYILTSLTVSCPVLSSVFMNLQVGPQSIFKIIGSLLVGISTISAALLPMLDCRKNWGLYRNEAEKIKTLLVEHGNERPEELMKRVVESTTITQTKWYEKFESTKSEK